MGWVSPKVYAILNSSEEGKDIIERLPDLSQDECDKMVDDFFGNGKGSSSKDKYAKAKEDDDFERNVWEHLDDKDDEEEDEISDEDKMKKEVIEDGKENWVRNEKDQEVWDNLTDDEKYLLSISGDMGVWFDEIQGTEAEEKYHELASKFSWTNENSKKKLLEMKQNKFYSNLYSKVFNEDNKDFTDNDKAFIIKMYENNNTPEKIVNEIKNTDYYKKMEKKSATLPFVDPDNEKVINQASQEFFNQITKGKNDAKFKNKQITIITGLPGAGKSSEEIKPFLEKSVELDNDIAKAVPSFANSYQNGLGAGKVHKASKKAEQMVMQRLIKEGYNVVIPMIGDDEDSILRRAKPFIDAGYEMPLLIHKEISNDESRKRAFKRAIETGRFIDDDVISAYGNSSNETHERLRKNKGVYNKDGKDYKFRIYEEETR